MWGRVGDVYVFLVRRRRELCQFRVCQTVMIGGRCRWLKKEMLKMERCREFRQKGLKLKLRPEIGKPISISALSGRKWFAKLKDLKDEFT
jgi:hypothetical protein